MKTLLEIERIAITVRHSLPPPEREPGRERRRRQKLRSPTTDEENLEAV